MLVLYAAAIRHHMTGGVIGLVALFAILALGACGKQEESSHGREMQKPRVAVSRPLERQIIEWDEYTGRFAAIDSVDVRARVSGYLESIHFTDGAVVHKGDLLFVIDPRPFNAALQQAKGNERQAEAKYDLARLELNRDRGLLEKHAISQDQYDKQLSATHQAEGEMQAAQGTLRNAQLNVEFTEVRSPINGRIGRHQISVGNLINGGTSDATALVTIVCLDPIYFYFDVDERTYLKYVRQGEEGKRAPLRELRTAAFVKLWNEKGFGHRGHIDYVDPRIDPSTGTLRFRAVFSNPQMTIRPGMFGRIRVPGSGTHKAMLLPGEAVGREQTIQYVYVVNKDNVVERRTIELGPDACDLRVVKKGLHAGDAVVIKGIQNVGPGMVVEPVEQKIVLGSTDCLANKYPDVFDNVPPGKAKEGKSATQ